MVAAQFNFSGFAGPSSRRAFGCGRLQQIAEDTTQMPAEIPTGTSKGYEVQQHPPGPTATQPQLQRRWWGFFHRRIGLGIRWRLSLGALQVSGATMPRQNPSSRPHHNHTG